ncbi:MAG: glutathione S-transferase family protein [Sphingorhabdus sp.]
MSKVDFYTNPMSRGQIARWALHEAEVDYVQHLLTYGDTMKNSQYLLINPMGKVPAIVHEGKAITECAAICAYLAEAFPESGLKPSQDELADYYRWLFFAAGPVESAVTNHAAGFDPSADREMMFGYGNYDRVIDVLDAHFGDRAFVCGSRFTAADVYVGSQIIWGTQFGTMPQRDNFAAYVERLIARPHYQAAKAIDTALIAESQTTK